MNQGAITPQISKYKITRSGRKLQITEDTRTIVALPKDVLERTWAEILQKEENDLIVFEIREEILEEALKTGYEHYMEKQNAPFAVHCAAQAWLRLIDWHFYRHDPGEDPSAYPPCFIPKRVESWQPDELPEPSPKDSWCKHDLRVAEDTSEEVLQRWPSSSSIDYPVVEEIPSEYWYPGKLRASVDEDIHHKYYSRKTGKVSSSYDSVTSESEDLAAESELLQNVTDYTAEELEKKESEYSGVKHTTPAESPHGTATPLEASLQGAGDSNIVLKYKKRHEKSKVFSKVSMGRSRAFLPPLSKESRSRMSNISVISDCRLRNLRLDTQYEISSEKVDTPPGEPVKRK